ncbi:CvfB family protein [Ilyobacter polytropus]|uniref:RNA binding S1 domain protein n=1 Tax=Ilyobacter polytropus (strain ATCC 51220 / DSM 2926 / LMG 16218 / CuHBu1) TaxID=572544 RepID=E3HBX8_ILYPC|nr:S1-like domain-containing RNA-binding protein [Ilyobacter polytropus]ADO84304.1 RNA binding S1 domain protein [Ilyobacter polytropus DSM 2926]
MIKIGKRQKMKVNNIASIGAYMDAETDNPKDNILLPNNEIENIEVEPGDYLDVFIYRDSEDRLIATLRKTYAVVGALSKLEVVDITEIGAFLDWGLNKDILLPRGQEEGKLKLRNKYLVGLYEDKKGRLSATMQIYKFLLPCNDYKSNDLVSATVYRIQKDIGVFVAVDDRYFGLIPKSECYEEYEVGQELELRVIRVREDGKLDLSPRALLHQQMDKDAEKLIEKMKLYRNTFPLNDKSSPEKIEKMLGMSKKAFKRAMGSLLKNGLVTKTEDGFKVK